MKQFIFSIFILSSIAALAYASTDTLYYRYDNTYQLKKIAYSNFTTFVSYDDAGNVTNIATNPTDTIPPTSTITAPAARATMTNVTCMISGTSEDGTGSGVGKVEVSTDDGNNWNLATGTYDWTYEWRIPSSGPHVLMSRATDVDNNAEFPNATTIVTAKSSLTADRASIYINHNLNRPAPITKVKVMAEPWNVSGIGTGSMPWLSISPGSSNTPSELVVTINPSGFTTGNYTGTVAYSAQYATNGPVEVPVTVTASDTPISSELQHYNWDASIQGGTNCALCHMSPNTFITPFNLQDSPGFCLSCHNAASVAHDKGNIGPVHSLLVNATSAGRKRPTYGNVTAGEINNQPKNNLKDRYAVVCNTCHNTMKKYEDYARHWELASSTDRKTYYLPQGGWSNYGYTVPQVYRSSSILGEPATSKSIKQYLVSPSEFSYDETAGSITFTTTQTDPTYIYVSLDYPYLRTSSEQDRLCSDCHAELTHRGNNCLTCHQAHNSNNLSDIRDKVRTADLSERTVKFTSRTGMNSFADGNTIYDGICEVCHSVTKYHRRDGTGFANHSGGLNQSGKDCTNCHMHNKGFSKYTGIIDGQQMGGGGLDITAPGALDSFSM